MLPALSVGGYTIAMNFVLVGLQILVLREEVQSHTAVIFN